MERIRGRIWLKIRARILRRDNGLCQSCLDKGKISIATEVDHQTALTNGGTNDDDNLISLCHDCHADKTARDTGKNRRKQIGIDGWPIG